MRGADPGDAPSLDNEATAQLVGPRSIHLEVGPSGRAALAYFAAGWLAALLTGGALTLVPATLASLMLITGVGAWRRARGLRLSLPSVVRARAGRTGSLIAHFERLGGRGPLEALEVRAGENLESTRARRCTIAPLAPGQAWRGAIPVRFESRGVRSSIQVDVRSVAPLGLWTLRLVFEIDTRVVVAPAVAGLRGYELPPSPRASRQNPERGTLRGQEEPAGLRPWRPGEGEARIHWRSSARLGRRVVREFENLERAPIEVRLITRTEGSVRAEDYERALELTASLLEELPRRGRRTWFGIDGEPARPLSSRPARMRALDRLAELRGPLAGESRAAKTHAQTGEPAGRGAPRQRVLVGLDSSGATVLDGAALRTIRSPLGSRVFELQEPVRQRRGRAS